MMSVFTYTTENQAHVPGENLKTIPITWPFAAWGLDMVGPFKRARGGMTHLLVMVDKFSNWVEAKCWGYAKWVYPRRSLIPASPGGPQMVVRPMV